MGLTKRTDLIYVDQLQEAIKAAFAGKLALYGTGAAILNTSLPTLGPDGKKLAGGDTIRVPYFDTVGELQDVTEGDALVPAKLSESSETSTVVHSGKAGEITKWAQLTAQFSDPYAEYGRQFAEAWIRRIDKGLITKAAATTLSLDISGLVGAAAQISYDAMVDASQKWNDEQEDIVLAVVHSKVYGDMLKLKDTTGRPLLVDPANQGDLPRFRGIPIKVSDRIAVAGGIYDNLICKKGALAAWANGEPEVLADKDILANSDVIAIHTYHVEHLYKRPSSGTLPGVVKLRCKAST